MQRLIIPQILTCIVLLSLLTYSACDRGDDGPNLTEVEKATRLLTGESVTGATVADFWSVNSVDVSGIDYLDVYEGFTIRFENETFTTTNGGMVFQPTGPWSFTDETATKINLDGLELTLIDLTETTMTFVFMVDETIYGRTKAVGGNNTFTLIR